MEERERERELALIHLLPIGRIEVQLLSSVSHDGNVQFNSLL